MLRPTLDDSSLQEKHIQDLTLDITRVCNILCTAMQAVLDKSAAHCRYYGPKYILYQLPHQKRLYL